MIEIFAILALAGSNGKKAVSRGRKPGAFQGITFALWLGMELFGLFIGALIFPNNFLSAYLIAIVFAVVGAVISRSIASNCKPGDYRPGATGPLPGARPLGTPATLTLHRESSAVGAAVKYSFFLNGALAGVLKNGEALNLSTALAENTLVAQDSYGNALPPLNFIVQDGAGAQVIFKGGRFHLERSFGIAPVTPEHAAALAAASGGQPPILPQQGGAPAPQSGTAAVPQYQSAAPEADPPDVKRPIWVMASGLILLMLIGLLPIDIVKRMGIEYISLISVPLLGFGLFLTHWECPKTKLIGGAGLLLCALFIPFTYVSCIAYMQAGTHEIGALIGSPLFGRNLLTALINSVVIGGIGFSSGKWLRSRLSFSAVVWIAAGVDLLIRLFNARMMLLQPAGYSLAAIFFSSVSSSAFIALSALLADIMCSLRGKTLSITTGARVWCLIVGTATAISVIVALAGRQSLSTMQSVIMIIAVVGMIMLACNRRMGFCLALLGSGLSVLFCLTRIFPFTPMSPTLIGSAIGGALNPFITWLFIRRAWRNEQVFALNPAYVPADAGFAQGYSPEAAYAHKKRLPAVFPVFVILGAVVGLVLFVAGVYALLDSRRFQIEPFIFGVICGGAISAVEIITAVLYFKRKGHTGAALQIIGLCIGAISVLTAIGGILSSL